MKTLTKSLLIAGSAMAIGASTIVGMGVASAQSATTTGKQTLVQKIAAKFGLKEAEVQSVFDQNRTEMETQHTANVKTKLDQAVKDGKLTQAQEDKIIAKQQEMKTFMESLKDKTEDERHAAMKTKMEEIKQWATDNGISEEFLRIAGPGGRSGHHGPGMGMKGDMMEDSTSATVPTTN